MIHTQIPPDTKCEGLSLSFYSVAAAVAAILVEYSNKLPTTSKRGPRVTNPFEKERETTFQSVRPRKRKKEIK